MNARLQLIVVTALFAVRMAVSIAHGTAHDQLAVPLAAWQNAFVWGVIVIAADKKERQHG